VAGELVDDYNKIYDLWETLEDDVVKFLLTKSNELNSTIEAYLKTTKDSSLKIEKENFEHRIKVLEKARKENTLERLNSRIQKVEEQIQQGFLFSDIEKDLLETKRNLTSEVQRRETLYAQQIEFIKKEMNRTLEKILPNRFTINGSAMIYPIGIEFRILEENS
jgi:hypothetical protein